ncbi:hypothetical protein NE236_22450 [Actinoallomurus purpureus]|uniref:hypothetical protein n=1 Tax=Actinoallomurus purpureus TaxID=478114 RepID=UPI0020925895|nr:hypothetical protein [Actinoallomurus purpureus]MCO6007742.1 hypothetical protein [Actinoallomurus purpureus]
MSSNDIAHERVRPTPSPARPDPRRAGSALAVQRGHLGGDVTVARCRPWDRGDALRLAGRAATSLH